MLATVVLAVLCQDPATPAPSPTPLKVIEHLTVAPLCTALRQNIAQSIIGLRVNDGLISQGQTMMGKVLFDAMNNPQTNKSAYGEAGGASDMDDVQMGHLVHALAQNLDRIDAFLNDTRVFVNQPNTDDQRSLELARERLQAVAAEQRRALNLLSETVDSNAMAELASRCDPLAMQEGGCTTGGLPPERVSLPKALSLEIQTEQQVETLVAPAVIAVVSRCR